MVHSRIVISTDENCVTLEIEKGNERCEFHIAFRRFTVIGTRIRCAEGILPFECDVLVGFAASADDMARAFCI